MPQSQAAANPQQQEKVKKEKDQNVQNKRTNAREARRPALSPKRGDHNAKRTEKPEDHWSCIAQLSAEDILN